MIGRFSGFAAVGQGPVFCVVLWFAVVSPTLSYQREKSITTVPHSKTCYRISNAVDLSYSCLRPMTDMVWVGGLWKRLGEWNMACIHMETMG